MQYLPNPYILFPHLAHGADIGRHLNARGVSMYLNGGNYWLEPHSPTIPDSPT